MVGLEAVRTLFNRFPDRDRPDNQILELVEISLVTNDFMFHDKHYLQVEGTATGKKLAPAYANIYMAEWERERY